MDRRAWDERYASTELLWTAEPNRFLVAEVGGLAPGRALDLACGEGRNAVWLASQGWEVTGVDFSRTGLDKARHLARQRHVTAEWILADVTTYRPAPAAVRPGHDPLPAAARRAARRGVDHRSARAAPGGTLLVVGHDTTNLAHGYGGPPDPTVLYTPDEIVSHLDGLVIDKAERVQRPVETDQGTIDAVDALVRAHHPQPPRPE